MGYVDLSTLHTPIGGARPPASYGRQIEANFDFLANPPRVHVYNDATQSIAVSGTPQALLFNQERYDTATMHSTTVNTDRLTATVAGTYTAIASVAFASNATGDRQVNIEHFDSAGVSLGVVAADGRPAVNGRDTHITCSAPDVVMAADDYLKVIAFQNSGAALNVLASSSGVGRYQCEASMRWAGLAA